MKKLVARMVSSLRSTPKTLQSTYWHLQSIFVERELPTDRCTLNFGTLLSPTQSQRSCIATTIHLMAAHRPIQETSSGLRETLLRGGNYRPAIRLRL